MVQFWWSSIFSTASSAAAIADAIGYTFVPVAIGFFLLRRAETNVQVRNRLISVLVLFFVMLWGGINTTNTDLRIQANLECTGSPNLASLTQPQKATYCDCFSSGSLPIVKSAVRRATVGTTIGSPMEDQVFVNAMQALAVSCPWPAE